VRTIYDSSNNILPNTTGATRIEYIVSVGLLRPASAISNVFTITRFGYNGTFVQPSTASTPHSPLINGDFTITIGGVRIDPYGNGTVPYNVPAWVIQNYLRANITGFKLV
jgi:hypothetical protein